MPKLGTYIGTDVTDLGIDATGFIYAIDSIVAYFTGWRSESCRTLTFLEPPTGELLAWLQANAVKQ